MFQEQAGKESQIQKAKYIKNRKAQKLTLRLNHVAKKDIEDGTNRIGTCVATARLNRVMPELVPVGVSMKRPF